MKGMSDFAIDDEAFFKITWAKSPEVHVLATAPMPAGGEVVPQMWTYERTIFGGQPFRAFVWMQGHTYTNFKNPQIEGMLLRAIAWAGHYPVDSLVNGAPPPRRAAVAGAVRAAPTRLLHRRAGAECKDCHALLSALRIYFALVATNSPVTPMPCTSTPPDILSADSSVPV